MSESPPHGVSWHVDVDRRLEDFREQIFYHELFHVMCWVTGSKDYGNEVIIDASGHALKQYMDTAVFK